jgi:hypothetical protein
MKCRTLLMGAIIKVTWFHEELAQVTKSYMCCSFTITTCVADSSSYRHFSQMGSSVNPNLERCPFRWQCPVNSPTIHLNWSLFNFNGSFVLLAEDPDISLVVLYLAANIIIVCPSYFWELDPLQTRSTLIYTHFKLLAAIFWKLSNLNLLPEHMQWTKFG